ncbi:MAG: FAD-binding molybdopterin dehydrogenase [Salinicola sp.]|uniref:FAD binding domain-containing protein n=1 Tax=uncultured Salinicola sp. TaxID=1193542 RepID=UPI000C8A4864|nr:xanthine dehydrogenase family protein subunit M [uncultured Salinicola sp.]MAM58651.1 FAD-binding molybdopterin dehydrogenase [Salinicola sp.]
MRAFSYSRPRTPEAAVAAFTDAGAGARYIAGGTTLFDLMKLNVEQPNHLVDVSELHGTDLIETSGDVLRFGAGARMADIADDETIKREYPLLAESLWRAASQQLRNMASVGGNLLQRTRCPYFRNGAGGVYPCNKRDPGTGCAAIDGLDRGQAVLGTSDACTAVSPGDWPVALTALDADIVVLGPQGNRTIPIADFYLLPQDTPDREFSLEPGELVIEIRVPKTAAGRASTYHKVRDRESYAFALAAAAVALRIEGGQVRQAHIALGGVATKPWRSREAEAALRGRAPTRENALAAGRAALAGAKAGRHNGFKIHLAANTIADAISIAAERSAS